MNKTNIAVYWVAIAIGASYMVPILTDMSGPAVIAWKVAGVAALTLWACLSARSVDG